MALTITANNASKLYGAALPTLSATYSGFVNGDSASSLTTAPTLSTTATASSNVGSYAITASGAVDPNYTISYVAGSLSVTPVALTITASNASKLYGAALPTLSASYSGFVNGDSASSLTTAPTLSTTATAGSNVGSYAITASGAVDANPNYTISYVAGSLLVTPVALTITASNASKLYGAALPTLSATYSGFVNGDSASSLTTAPTLSTTATASSNVGSYAITASGAVDPNYTISYVAGSLSVTQVALTITASNASKLYGAALPTLSASYSGFVNGNTSASLTTQPTLSTTATAGSNVGSYAITASGAVDPNYTISYVAGSLSVTPAPLTITANNQTRVYGAANPTLTATYGGFVNGNTTASLTTQPTISTTATATSNVGSYPITVGGAVDPNYTISYLSGTLIISQDATTTVATASTQGETVTLTATVTANAPGSGTPTGTVEFFDTTTNTVLANSVTLSSSGSATLQTALMPGTQTITVTYSGSSNFLSSSGTTSTAPLASLYLLNPTANGALTISGSAAITVPGVVEVDSNSTTAIAASGAASITAMGIQIVGRYSATGSARLSPTPSTGVASFADPLASLPVPSVTGTSNGAVTIGGVTTETLQPGIYSSINISASASVTMAPGIYVIKGGGLTVSGAASLTGSGVTIYNAGSNYPSTGGSFGGITLSGSGTMTLSAPTTGTYAGIVIFQSRDNTQTLNFSGAEVSGLNGSVYAPGASLTLSGSASLKDALIVNTMNLSGAAVFSDSGINNSSGAQAYTPDQIRTAYGINDLALDGSGQTIAIIDAYDDPTIDQAVNTFDSQFSSTESGSNLYDEYGPASSFLTVINQNGQTSPLPGVDPTGPGVSNWEMEEELDVEWSHALSPGAQIVLVEANSQSLSDLMSAVVAGASQPNVSVVSMSWGFEEGLSVVGQDEALYDQDLTTPAGHQGVTFVASTGDYGAAVPEYPAYSPNVVAVGGTSLYLNSDNSYNSETGWGYFSNAVGAFIGSGGGASLYEAEPGYQMGVQSTGYRTAPDVAFVADPSTGVWVADPYNLPGGNPWETVGGTSLSAPAWASLFALANQGRAAAGEGSLGSSADPTATQEALYNLPQSDFNSVTTGFNGYTASSGYNLVTGLGTPIVNELIPDLVANTVSANSQRTVTVTASDLQSFSGGGTGGGSESIINVFDAVAISQPGHVPTNLANGSVGNTVLQANTVTSGSKAAIAVSNSLENLSLTGNALDRAGATNDKRIGGTANRYGSSGIETSADVSGGSPGQTSLHRSNSGGDLNGNLLPRRIINESQLPALTGPGFSVAPVIAVDATETGHDVLIGGDGDDMLIGTPGNDVLVGGFGSSQTIHASAAEDQGAADAIIDLNGNAVASDWQTRE